MNKRENKLGIIGFIKNKIQAILNLFNVDLEDQNRCDFTIYAVTYVVSVVAAAIPHLQHLSSLNDLNNIVFINAFCASILDCVVPTAVTLVIGSAIQNIVEACKNRVTRLASSIWLIVLAFSFLMIYLSLRNIIKGWWNILFAGGVVVMHWLERRSKATIKGECMKDTRSLSGYAD